MHHFFWPFFSGGDYMEKEVKNMSGFINDLNSNGIPIDKKEMNNLILKLNEEKISIEKKINNELIIPINFNSLEKLAFVLYENEIYPEELSYEYFKEKRHENMVYELLCQYKKTLKNMNLIKNIMEQIDCDGRLRGIWKLNGSQTKRLSCSKPNLMALPKAVTNCVVPDDNNIIIKCDFSQIELKILAELTQDENLIEAFKNGDIHRSTAALVYNKPVQQITDQERASCKAINYGIIYGISAAGLKNNLADLDINISLSQAALLRNRFLSVFSGVSDYQNKCCTANELCSLGGTVINASGMSINQKLNWEIQTSCSEILLTIIEYFMKNKKDSTKLINSIHDELWIEASIENWDYEEENLSESMQKAFEKYIHSTKFAGDIETIERI